MRVVGGKYKSRSIEAPFGDKTRPTSDKTRESIFNILMPYLRDAQVLDLFAGSGALGIEALSRGASHVTFIDKDSSAIRTIKKNCENLKIMNEVTIIKADYQMLPSLSLNSFDILLLDPPYKMDVFDEILQLVEANNLLSPSGVIVYETNREHQLTHEYEGYHLKQYRYGIAYLSVLKKIVE